MSKGAALSAPPKKAKKAQSFSKEGHDWLERSKKFLEKRLGAKTPGLKKNPKDVAHKALNAKKGAKAAHKEKKPSIRELGTKLRASTLSISIDKASFARPDFDQLKTEAARLEAALATQDPAYLTARLDDKDIDLAAPHRAPYAKIRDKVLNDSPAEVEAAAKEMMSASEDYERGFSGVKINEHAKYYHHLAGLYKALRENVARALVDYKKPNLSENEQSARKLELIEALNNLASNAPGLGPHSTTNRPVNDRIHVQPTNDSGTPLTPRGAAAIRSFPKAALATSGNQKNVVSASGAHYPIGKVFKQGSPPLLEDVKAKDDRVLRASLWVRREFENGEKTYRVYRPRDPTAANVGSDDWKNDWERVE